MPWAAILLMIAGVLIIIRVWENRNTADEQNAMSPSCGILDALCYATGAL